MQHNPYTGVNAHLNSALQQRGGGWRSFHSKHITHLADLIEPLLPDGYFTSEEPSLQMGAYDPQTDLALPGITTTVADVGVYRERPQPLVQSGAGRMGAADANALLLPLRDTLVSEEVLSSTVIYRLHAQSDPVSVTRIELLSPANKYPGSHYLTYLAKRSQTLYGGLRLVEIDYLHTQRPLLSPIPDYSAGVKDALPYHVMISDPQPIITEAQVVVLRWGVFDPIPTIPLPLDADQPVVVDLNAIYQYTLSRSRQFTQVKVDYTHPPPELDRYQLTDQQRLRDFSRGLIA